MKLMRGGQAFVGFSEAPIKFPPTFKYDVLRTLKRAKRHGSKLDRSKHPEDRPHQLTEAEERQLEQLEKEAAEEEAEGEGEEGASMASSIWTSAHSRTGTDRDPDEDEFFTSPSVQTMATSTSKVSIAAHKAKAKWLSLLAQYGRSPHRHFKLKHNDVLLEKTHSTYSSVDVASNALLAPPIAATGTTSLDNIDRTRLRPPPMILMNSTKSSLPSDEEGDNDEKGVYDSSHKKRVPSWHVLFRHIFHSKLISPPRCDRILWKTTVEPDPEPTEEVADAYTRPRNRMGQFFANAFRPLSARRRDSVASTTTLTTPNSHEEAQSPSSSSHEWAHVHEDATPFSRSVQRSTATMDRPRSTEFQGVETSKSTNHRHPEIPLRRSSSVTISCATGPLALERVPIRRATAYATLTTDMPATVTTYTQTPTPSRWRFLPSFLSNASTQSSASFDPPQSVDTAPPPPPRKGDVVCLSYHTLDDRGMRRLEGRSDHRPVIGSYVIYL